MPTELPRPIGTVMKNNRIAVDNMTRVLLPAHDSWDMSSVGTVRTSYGQEVGNDHPLGRGVATVGRMVPPPPGQQSHRGWKNNLLTPWNRVLLEKLTGPQLVKKLPAFYGTRRFITALTSAHHLSLSWARSIQSIPLTSHILEIHLLYYPPINAWVS